MFGDIGTALKTDMFLVRIKENFNFSSYLIKHVENNYKDKSVRLIFNIVPSNVPQFLFEKKIIQMDEFVVELLDKSSCVVLREIYHEATFDPSTFRRISILNDYDNAPIKFEIILKYNWCETEYID